MGFVTVVPRMKDQPQRGSLDTALCEEWWRGQSLGWRMEPGPALPSDGPWPRTCETKPRPQKGRPRTKASRLCSVRCCGSAQAGSRGAAEVRRLGLRAAPARRLGRPWAPAPPGRRAHDGPLAADRKSRCLGAPPCLGVLCVAPGSATESLPGVPGWQPSASKAAAVRPPLL